MLDIVIPALILGFCGLLAVAVPVGICSGLSHRRNPPPQKNS